LDATELLLKDSGDGANKKGLSEARDSFDERMTAGEKRDQYLIDRVLVSDDHFPDLSAKAVQGSTHRAKPSSFSLARLREWPGVSSFSLATQRERPGVRGSGTGAGSWRSGRKRLGDFC